MEEWNRSFVLFLALLNPFLMSIYLLDLIEELSFRTFARVLGRATFVSACVFVLFAWGGERIFVDLLQVRFASFQIFGGLVFALIGFQFLFKGPRTIKEIRGKPEHVAGSIALPFIIGPGTISASVVVGQRLPLSAAVFAIAAALFVAALCLMMLKVLYDNVRSRNVALIERYVDIVGRASALLIGTIAIDMVCVGIEDVVGR